MRLEPSICRSKTCVVDICPAHQIIQFAKRQFFKNKPISRHLKLDIALAIPALNDGK